MKYLIINADDFGMSREVNEGIKKGIDAGAITSVSVMVGMPFFADAVKFLKKHPEVSIGLHFNITEGLPLQKPFRESTLLREDNSYYHWVTQVLKLIFRAIDLSEVRSALEVQYRKLHQTGLPILHIDSHHHMHLFPSIFEVFVKFAKQKKIAALRTRRFSIWSLRHGFRSRFTIKKFLIVTMCWLDSFVIKNARAFFDVESIYDINWDKDLTLPKLLKIVRNLPEGTTEFICHPAVNNKDGNQSFLAPRAKGLQLLLSTEFMSELKKNNVILISRHESKKIEK